MNYNSTNFTSRPSFELLSKAHTMAMVFKIVGGVALWLAILIKGFYEFGQYRVYNVILWPSVAIATQIDESARR